MNAPRNSDATEEARIREVYEHRTGEDRYSWFNDGHQMIIQSAERALLHALRRAGITSIADRTILEVGCGTGQWIRALVRWGAQPSRVTGVDLLADRIASARQLCAPGSRLLAGSAAKLPFPDASFDIVLQSTVFTSILDEQLRAHAAAEMLRVLRPSGVLLWYDFFVDNPRNPDVRAVRRRELEKLFPSCAMDLRRTTLAPPLARWIAPRSWVAGTALSIFPFLCTHYAGTIRRSGR